MNNTKQAAVEGSSSLALESTSTARERKFTLSSVTLMEQTYFCLGTIHLLIISYFGFYSALFNTFACEFCTISTASASLSRSPQIRKSVMLNNTVCLLEAPSSETRNWLTKWLFRAGGGSRSCSQWQHVPFINIMSPGAGRHYLLLQKATRLPGRKTPAVGHVWSEIHSAVKLNAVYCSFHCSCCFHPQVKDQTGSWVWMEFHV